MFIRAFPALSGPFVSGYDSVRRSCSRCLRRRFSCYGSEYGSKEKPLRGDGKFIQFMRRDVLPISPSQGVTGNANGFEKALVREFSVPGSVDIRLHIEQAPFIVTENNQKKLLHCPRIWHE